MANATKQAEQLEATRVLSATWQAPKSLCQCGHEGDGPHSAHGGTIGHGACSVIGCACAKFSWRSYTPAFVDVLRHRGIES
jgi:hypothetical protein